MTAITLYEESGPRHHALARLIHEAASAAAPLVEETTKLPLPTNVAIRLMKPDDWASAYSEFHQGLWNRQRGTLAFQVGSDFFQQTREYFEQTRKSALRKWTQNHVRVIEDPYGTPEVQILSATLREMQPGADWLLSAMACNLTLLAQHAASYGRTMDVAEGLAPGEMCRSARRLGIGHALWAAKVISRKRLGHTLPLIPTTGSSRYQAAIAQQSDSITGWEKTADAYSTHIADTIRKTGVPAFNGVWGVPALWPRDDESALHYAARISS